MRVSFDDERQVVLFCARPYLTNDTILQLRKLVQSELRWEHLFKTALHHALLPLLCVQLKKYCSDILADEITVRLKDISFSNSARSLFQTGVLLQILELFRKNDIQSLGFKGPVLAVTA